MAKRRQISKTARELAAKKAAELFIAHPLYRNNQTFACYFSTAEEFDTAPLLEVIFKGGKKSYLPVLGKDNAMHFAAHHPGDELTANRFNILEPKGNNYFPNDQLDVVLLPLVAFDKQGNRLGKGGGYYDKTFSFLLDTKRGRPFLLGVGYEDQEAPELSSDIWDVKLDGVLTEHRLIIFNRHILFKANSEKDAP